MQILLEITGTSISDAKLGTGHALEHRRRRLGYRVAPQVYYPPCVTPRSAAVVSR